MEVIEHIKDPDNFLQEVKRVLKPHGYFLLTFPNIRYMKYLIELFVIGKFPTTSLDKGLYDGGHIHYFTYQNIAKLLEKQKMKIIFLQRIITTDKLKILRSISSLSIAREFFSAGLLIISQK